jgi:hypothetical protein
MKLTKKGKFSVLLLGILLSVGVMGVQQAFAISFNGLNVALDCTSFNYSLYALTTDRNNTGNPPGSEAEAYDIVVRDGAGTVLHYVSNTLSFNTYFDGPSTPGYNQGVAPQYNPITFTWISRLGNGLPAQVAYTATGTCPGLPTYAVPKSSLTSDVEPQFDPGDDRLNRANKDRAAPVAIFCMDWGVEVRVIDYATSIGIDPPAITALNEDVDALGVPTTNTLLGEGSGVRLYRLTTGEFAVFARYANEAKDYIFVWDQCPVPTNVYHVSV